MAAGSDPTGIPTSVLLDVAVIVVVAQAAGVAFRRLGQPAVIGEIIAGILLGPSVLGALPGDPSTALFPTDARPFLKVLGDLGLIVFIFLVGMELDLRRVRQLERAAAISLASVVLPFGLGILLAAGLYSSHDIVNGSAVDFVPFALFMGVTLSITAFPVLARILEERAMSQSYVGALALACAAVDDVLGWSILALALAVLEANGGVSGFPLTLLEAVAFVVGMVTVVKPLLLDRLAARFAREQKLERGVLASILAVVAASAWITHEIGVNFVFGAFVAGVVFPKQVAPRLLPELRAQLEPLAFVVLLPIFFILPGLSVDIRGLGVGDLGDLGLIMLAACGGKFLGGAGMARALGSRWREAAMIGTLLNARGVMGLVVVNVGLAAGVIDIDLYTLLVLMAVLTTLMTTPLLRRIERGEEVSLETQAALTSDWPTTTREGFRAGSRR